MNQQLLGVNPENFFKQIYDLYKKAVSVTGKEILRDYYICDYLVRLRFAGTALIPVLTPVLEHLRDRSSENNPQLKPHLTICLWDSTSSEVMMPQCPWQIEKISGRGDVPNYNTERFCTSLLIDVGALSLLDKENNLGIYWVNEASSIPCYERSATLKNILYWWLQQRDRLMLHAAAVATDEGGVLLVGRSGAGKSTTAIACADSGLGYLGDDHCVLSMGSEPYVYSVYNAAKLHPEQMQKFPRFLSSVSNPQRLAIEKALVYIHQHNPQQVVNSAPVRLVLLPQITGKALTFCEPVNKALVLRELAISTFVALSLTPDRQDFLKLAAFIRNLPCYQLALGTDLKEVPKVVAKAIQQLSIAPKNTYV